MYKLGVENPAKKNVLKINQVCWFIIHIVDDLIIVHHQLTQSSLIYDIKMAPGTDGYVTYNNLVIKKAQIKQNLYIWIFVWYWFVLKIRLKQMKISIILFNLYQKLTNQFSRLDDDESGNLKEEKNDFKLESHYLKLNKDYKF